MERVELQLQWNDGYLDVTIVQSLNYFELKIFRLLIKQTVRISIFDYLNSIIYFIAMLSIMPYWLNYYYRVPI